MLMASNCASGIVQCAWDILQCSLYTVQCAVWIKFMYFAISTVTVFSVHYTICRIKFAVSVDWAGYRL